MKLQRGVFLDYGTVDNGDLDRARLEATLPDWTWHDNTAPRELADRLAGMQVAISNKVPLDRGTLAAATELRLVALAATGTDTVDLAAAAEHGITVCNSRDYATASVAQHTITLILNLLTHQPGYARRVREGAWTEAGFFSMHDRTIREAAALTLGIIGHGVLGEAVAQAARCLGMKVVIAERKGQAPRAGREPFWDVVESADVISLHCPLNEHTRGLVDEEFLARMKQDALLVNTARGAIVDEAALAAALRAGRIGGAGLDVLSQEPPPPDHPLLAPDIPNVLLTPHNAWASRRSRQAVLDQLADLVEAFKAGEPEHVVAGP